MAYTYKKKITITGQSGAGTDYQVLLNVGESSGSSGANFHLEGNSLKFPATKNDGGDIKFFASDESTVLKFWVESVTGSSPNRTAKIWVKVTADLGSNQDIYIYYGDSGASNLSNGDDTFIFFDDFEDNTIDTNKWVISSGGAGDSITEASDNLTIVCVSPAPVKTVQSKNPITGDLEVLSSSMVTTMASGNNIGVMIMDANQNDGNGIVGFYKYNTFSRYSRSTGTWSSIGSSGSFSFNTYYSQKLRIVGSSASFYNNGSIIGGSWTKSLGTNRYISIPRVWNENTGEVGTLVIDYVAVKKIIATEPAFNSAGSEQSTIVAPTITTTSVSHITNRNAQLNLELTSDGGGTTTIGTCHSTAPNPVSTDNPYTKIAGVGTYQLDIPNLLANTKYYVRSFATNSAGTSYGAELDFTTNSESKILLQENGRALLSNSKTIKI